LVPDTVAGYAEDTDGTALGDVFPVCAPVVATHGKGVCAAKQSRRVIDGGDVVAAGNRILIQHERRSAQRQCQSQQSSAAEVVKPWVATGNHVAAVLHSVAELVEGVRCERVICAQRI